MTGAPRQLARAVTPNVLGVVAQLARSADASYASLAVRGDAFTEAVARTATSEGVEADDPTLAWELARLVTPPHRAAAFSLVMRVLGASRSGSTRLPIATPRAEDDLAVEAQLQLPFESSGEGRAIDPSSLSPLVGSFGEGAPLVRSASHVALHRWAATERSIASDLAARARKEASAEDLERRRDQARAGIAALRAAPLVGPRGPMSLTDEQEAAVLSMAVDRTAVLTGGPGTGKTSVVVSLLRVVARRAFVEGGEAGLAREVRLVALAAPTGKAADRLGEAVRTALAKSNDPIDALLDRHLESPRTIHRLLGYRHGGGRHRVGRGGDGSFRAHRHNPLAERLVLVDEVSMIDTVLFERLLAAVSPDASLVLLGDPDQLPSVDPGAVLRDLLAASPLGVRVSRLTKSHRMDPSDPDGAHVLSVARACLAVEGGAPPFRRVAADPRETPVGRGGAWHLDASSLTRALDDWIGRHLLVPALAALDDVTLEGADETPPAVLAALAQLSLARILTVTRRAAEDLDAYVSASFARWRGAPSRARRVLPGEPVMVVHNDYDADLWNGDAGVAWRDRASETYVSFRRGTGVRTRPLAAVAHLVERSHAVTVHKAQGSEHDEIFFVLPSQDTPLSSREIVYTAITRARRSAIVVGRPELLELALTRRSVRETGLVDALAGVETSGGDR